jgi:transcriptional regulator NrdR family protein
MNEVNTEKPATSAQRGICCRKCGCKQFHVVYTRRGTGERIIRRRECRHCGTRLTTWERVAGAG